MEKKKTQITKTKQLAYSSGR